MNNVRIVAFLVSITLLLQCRSAAPSAQGQVKFMVGSCEGPGLESVRVTYISRSGKEVLLGVTGVSGTLKVPRASLADARYVVFHCAGYFDGLLRIEEVTGDMEYIMLAPFAVL